MQRINNIIKNYDKFNRMIEVLIGVILLVMTISIFIQVLVRLGFTYFNISFSVPWTEELARYLLFWLVFLGAAIGIRKSRMISMKAILTILPSNVTKALIVLVNIIELTFYVILIKLGYNWAFGAGLNKTSTAMGLPMVFIYSAVFIGSILMSINTLISSYEYLVKKEK